MEQKLVSKLEQNLEAAIAEVIVAKMGLSAREVQDSTEGGYRTSSVFCPSL